MKSLPYIEGFESARLPVNYESAKKHLAELEKRLAECMRDNESRDWKDKAEELEFYARLANDDDLYIMTQKIQNRARRRMRALLR